MELFKVPAICFNDFILSIAFPFHWYLLLLLLFSSFFTSFSRLLWWELRLLIWEFFSFLMYAFSSINFLLSTVVSHKFSYHLFYFSLINFISTETSFLTHRLFRNELFSFQAFLKIMDADFFCFSWHDLMYLQLF